MEASSGKKARNGNSHDYVSTLSSSSGQLHIYQLKMQNQKSIYGSFVLGVPKWPNAGSDIFLISPDYDLTAPINSFPACRFLCEGVVG